MTLDQVTVEEWASANPVRYGEICVAARSEMGLTSFKPVKTAAFKELLAEFHRRVNAAIYAELEATRNACPDDAVVDDHCDICGEFESECVCDEEPYEVNTEANSYGLGCLVCGEFETACSCEVE